MAGEDEQHRQADDGDERNGEAPEPRPLTDVDTGERQRESEEQQDGHEVQQPFDDDGRERRGRLEPLAAREEIRAKDIADTRRQQGNRHEADHRRAKCGPKAHRAERLQQRDPPPRASDVRRERRHDRRDEVDPVRFGDCRPRLPEVEPAEEIREETNGQGRDE